jgi:hypothetical protein
MMDVRRWTIARHPAMPATGRATRIPGKTGPAHRARKKSAAAGRAARI